jgi:hypothetical protein
MLAFGIRVGGHEDEVENESEDEEEDEWVTETRLVEWVRFLSYFLSSF